MASNKLKKDFATPSKQSTKPRNNAEKELLKRVGKKLKNELVKQGFSVLKFAIESDTSRGSVRRVFAGESNVTLLTLDRMAKTLGYEDAIEFLRKL